MSTILSRSSSVITRGRPDRGFEALLARSISRLHVVWTVDRIYVVPIGKLALQFSHS
jgi:hypothetical protein